MYPSVYPARGKTNHLLTQVAKAVAEMMANRSDRRLLSLFMTEAYFGKAAYLMRRRRADSIRARALFKRLIKRHICEQPDSPILRRQSCAEAGSIYVIKDVMTDKKGRHAAPDPPLPFTIGNSDLKAFLKENHFSAKMSTDAAENYSLP